MTSATTAHPTIRASVRHHTMAPRANTMTIRTVDASMISTDQSCARSATAVGGRTDHGNRDQHQGGYQHSDDHGMGRARHDGSLLGASITYTYDILQPLRRSRRAQYSRTRRARVGAVAGVRVVLSWPPAVRTRTESAGGAREDLRCTAGLVWSDAESSAACTGKVP